MCSVWLKLLIWLATPNQSAFFYGDHSANCATTSCTPVEIVDLTSTQLKHVSRRAAAAEVVVVVVYVVDFFKSTQKRFFVSVKTRADSDHFLAKYLVCYVKTVSDIGSRIQTWIVKVEGEHADLQTTTHGHPREIGCTLAVVSRPIAAYNPWHFRLGRSLHWPRMPKCIL